MVASTCNPRHGICPVDSTNHQDLGKLQTRKVKALKRKPEEREARKAKKAKEAGEEAMEE